LRAFQRVALDPGKKTRVSFELPIGDLSHYDAKSGRGVVDAGRYELMIGASSADIRQRASFEVTSS
jgi:beta-glucosidase